MAGLASTAPGNSDRGVGTVEAFLVEYIRSHPGLRFGVIVQATQQACRSSRATTAKHLARLVRFGELVLLPDHTYVRGEPTSATARATLEYRSMNTTLIISASGSAQALLEPTFRVVAGELDHMEFQFPYSVRHPRWWRTMAGQEGRLPDPPPSRTNTYRLDFGTPLTARRPVWQSICLSLVIPGAFRMSRPSSIATRKGAGRESATRETLDVPVSSQGRRFGRCFAPDARLRQQAIFPIGYPVGAARGRVLYLTEPDRRDTEEEARIEKLAENRGYLDGLHRVENMLSLSVPRPRLDRIYGVEWDLPTRPQFDHWRARERAGHRL
jgi:hypothetical protein